MHMKLLKFTLIAPYLPLFYKKRLGSVNYQVNVFGIKDKRYNINTLKQKTTRKIIYSVPLFRLNV